MQKYTAQSNQMMIIYNYNKISIIYFYGLVNGNFVLMWTNVRCCILVLDNIDFITVSDIGILIDTKFTFHKQCSTAVTKANKLLGIIRRSFEYINADTMLCLYKLLIRPIIEYENVIWGPDYVIDQQYSTEQPR